MSKVSPIIRAGLAAGLGVLTTCPGTAARAGQLPASLAANPVRVIGRHLFGLPL